MIISMLCSVVLFLIGTTCAVDPLINSHSIPDGFSLGVATAAYQIEGAWNEDGKGENMWDWYTHTYPEKITGGANGDIACDSYHKWKEDVQLAKDLGVDHYRLSIMWTRILPDGGIQNQTVNENGVKYYRNLIQALLDAGITPLVTLYHWDLPRNISDMGGWLNPITAEYFANYSRICYQNFGDLVKNWVTINEPDTYCELGYAQGDHAPGYTDPAKGIYQCAKVTLLAHAKAYRVYESEFKKAQKGRVSIVLSTGWFGPKSYSLQDTLAAKRGIEFTLGLYAHPIYKGNWPQIVIDIVNQRSKLEGFTESRLPALTDAEIKLIANTSDFFSINTYASYVTEHQNDVTELISKTNASYYLDQGTKLSLDPSLPSDVNWIDLSPTGMRKLLNYIYYYYGQPEIIVTENGWADLSGTLQDTDRITYIKQYLSAVLDAYYTDGVNVKGYTVWSLMDNLEWTHGYSQKLGLIQVDFNSVNRTRTPKESFHWYKDVIKNRCLVDTCH